MSYLELKKMVAFFYSMNYDDDISEATERETSLNISLLQLHARMFALGDRYDIPGLREAAVKKYSSRCAAIPEPVEFIESIYNVYERTPTSIKQLRNAACTLMRKNLLEMLDDKTVATVYEKVLVEVPEFTRNMLELYVRAPSYGSCTTCGSNQAFEVLQARCRRCGKGRSGL